MLGRRGALSMVIGQGSVDRYLSWDTVRQIVSEAVPKLAGRRVLVIIPDGTRTMPMPEMFQIFREIVHPKVRCLDFLVALGTHPVMNDAQLSKLVGQKVVDGKVDDINVFNHHWEDPKALVTLGDISSDKVGEATGGLMSQPVRVRLNRLILDYDHLVVCGPVFPHEVVGFSGGNKYFFPGIAGAEIINFTHWLGAVITNYKVIGAGYTPVRAVIDRAAELIPRETWCFAFVLTHEGIAGLYFAKPRDAWNSASALSAKKHIVYVDKPYKRVLSVMPELYDDIWTAGKGMYKLEPAVADGGEVVIYAPHIDEVSYTHGKLIEEIGYHCRDFFLKQWPKYHAYPGGVLAHSTHVKGLGTYDADTGVETPRVQVTLATQISEDRCRRINLGYMDPNSIKIEEWQGREKEGILVVPRAGEMLYRVKES